MTTARYLSFWRRLVSLYQREIWQPAFLVDTSFRGYFYAAVRIVSITITGLQATRATSRAAALSFSTLLGLGPLIGLAVLIAGFALGKNDPNLVAAKVNELLKFVAPQIGQLEQIEEHERNTAAPIADGAPPVAAKTTVNPHLVDLINTFIAGARSSTVGVLSILSLMLIVLLLFTSIEDVFNDIWGVRIGRPWLTRIVFYWTILTLGAVLFFGAVGALSFSTFLGYFRNHLPFGAELATALSFFLPALSGVVIILILTIFYRYIPNTLVSWRAAVVGAIVVAVLIALNNLLAFSYLRRVDMTRSLYGSLGIVPILMFGLYIFWLFVLVGGQISYAVQNVHFRNSQIAWSSLTASVRERLTLAVFLAIARRFQACLPPCTASEISSTVRVPAQVLNEALSRLVDLKFISPIPPSASSSTVDFLYQPARPLNRITLGDFKHLFEHYGENPAGDSLNRCDPLLERYDSAISSAAQQDLFKKTLEELLEEG